MRPCSQRGRRSAPPRAGGALPRRHARGRGPLRGAARAGGERDRHRPRPRARSPPRAPGWPASARPSAPCAPTSATPRASSARSGIEAVDGALVDLGVSSPQLDEAGARLLLLPPGPPRHADVRARARRSPSSSSAPTSASSRASSAEYGEEPFARPVARAIKRAVEREGRGTSTPPRLAEIVARRHPAPRLAAQHPPRHPHLPGAAHRGERRARRARGLARQPARGCSRGAAAPPPSASTRSRTGW